MALRDQPYLPLYIQDFLTDEKLMVCSAETTGVYIRLLCILHKQKEYGVFLLKQNAKQGVPTCLDFASQLDLFMPYKEKVIESAISELLLHDVIQQDGSKLLQKRMIIDNDISLKRASAGSKGGKKTQFAKANVKANTPANPEDESEDDIEVVKDIEQITKLLSDNFTDLKFNGGHVNSVIWDTINRFASDFPELLSIKGWQSYVSELIKSDWIMGTAVGKTARTMPITLDFLCREKTYLKAFTGGWENVEAKKDPNAYV